MSYTIPTEFPARPFQNTIEDKQTIFSAVWDYFITQGNPPCFIINTFGGKSCQYRGAGGSDIPPLEACAVGIFLPECPEMQSIFPIINQSYGIEQLFCKAYADQRVPPLIKRVFSPDLKDFLKNLQSAHDNSVEMPNPTESIQSSLINLATQEGLTIPA